MRVTNKPYVTNWASLLTKSGRTEVESSESSEHHEVLFTRTFGCRGHVFPIISSDVNAPCIATEWKATLALI